jgi:hypothetical protein
VFIKIRRSIAGRYLFLALVDYIVVCGAASSCKSSRSLGQLRSDCWVQSAKQQEGYSTMGKKIIVTALTVFAFGFGSALRSNAGTEMIGAYGVPAPAYDYAPPPRPVYYAPPPVSVVVVQPAYVYYGPRFGFYGGHRFYTRHGYWRPRHHWD